MLHRCAAVALSTVLAAMLGACNPFRTGEPESPTGVHVEYPPATTTDNVLTILSMAMRAEDNRAFLDRLAPTFRFQPDPVQTQDTDFRLFPADWGPAQEEVSLAVLFSNSDSTVAVWSSVFTQTRVDGALVNALYRVDVYARGASAPVTYAGRAEFLMAQEAGSWEISQWRDNVESGNPSTWGLLRARLLGSG